MKWKTERHSWESQQNLKKASMKYDGNVKGIVTRIEERDTQVETINPIKLTSMLVVLVTEAMNSNAPGQERKLLQVTIQN